VDLAHAHAQQGSVERTVQAQPLHLHAQAVILAIMALVELLQTQQLYLVAVVLVTVETVTAKPATHAIIM
jgi:hypothetical protein